jgi:hypothetical protein
MLDLQTPAPRPDGPNVAPESDSSLRTEYQTAQICVTATQLAHSAQALPAQPSVVLPVEVLARFA